MLLRAKSGSVGTGRQSQGGSEGAGRKGQEGWWAHGQTRGLLGPRGHQGGRDRHCKKEKETKRALQKDKEERERNAHKEHTEPETPRLTKR